MAVRIKLRRDTAANWTSNNPVLEQGEPGVETDTLKVKVGDGVTAWNSLDYSISNDFGDLLNTPTTLSGYGITDALQLSGLSVTQNAASGSGALTYNNSTGVFEYTPPSFEALNGNFTGSVFADDSTLLVDGVAAKLNLANNSITDLSDADQTVRTSDDVEFNKVTTNSIDTSDSSAITMETDVEMLAGLTVGNHILPSSNENIDLGSAANRFRDLYLSGSTINLGGTTISAVGGAIQLPVGTNIGGVKAPDQTLDTTDDATFNSVTGNVFTSLIDSTDSSAITITPDVVLSAGLTVGNHILPSSSLNIDLGSDSFRFRDLYLSGSSAIIGDLALKRHTSGGLLVADHSTGDPTNITTHNITANDVTAAGNVDVTGNLTMTGYIAGPATFTIDPAAVGDNTGTVVIAGNLQVDGTTTTINSTTVEVGDKNIVLGADATADTQNDGAGITVSRPDSTDATIAWDETDDEWDITNQLNVAGTVIATEINLDATGDIHSTVDTGYVGIAGGTNSNVGANALFYGGTHATLASVTKFRSGSTSTLTISSAGEMVLGSSGTWDFAGNHGIQIDAPASDNASLFLVTDSDTIKGLVAADVNTNQINIGAITNHPVAIKTNDQERIFVKATGEVGIGTTSPDGPLEISNGSERHRVAFGTGEVYLMARNATEYIIQEYIANQHVFTGYGDNSSNEAMRIDENGRLGIGTTDPSAQLHIAGTGGSQPAYVYLERVDSAVNADNEIGGVHFYAGESSATKVGAVRTIAADAFTASSSPTYMVFETTSSGSTDDAERVRIDSVGRVLVGTTTSNVYYNSTTQYAGDFVIDMDIADNVTDLVLVNSNNSFGSTVDFATNNSAGNPVRHGLIGAVPESTTAGSESGRLIFSTKDTTDNNIVERVRITPSGDVSIGAGSSPSERLQIGGNIRAGNTGATTSFDGGGNDRYIGVSSLNGGDAMFIAHASGYGVGYFGYEPTDDKLIIACDNGGGNNTIDFSLNAGTTANGATDNLTGVWGDPELRISSTAHMVHVRGDTADTGTTGGSKGLSIYTGGGTSCPIYFGSESNSAQKSMYMTGYWIYLRGHQNEGIRFVFSQGAGSAPRADQYEFKYNSATRPTGSTTWDGFSDARAKENVRDLTGALDTINQLRPVRYDWTNDYADSMNMWNMDTTDEKSYNWTSVKENGYDLERKNDQYGFIAQEFETVFPHDVKETKVTLGEQEVEDFKTVNYDSLVPTLTKAVQELSAQVQALQEEVNKLKGE